MESWNNLQTCFACLWQKWKDYFKFCGNVNKQDSIDVIGIAPSVSAHILTWFSFLSSEETTFAMPPWRLHDGYSRDLLRRNRSGAIYQVLNENPTPPSHRETTSHTRCTAVIGLFVKGRSPYLVLTDTILNL